MTSESRYCPRCKVIRPIDDFNWRVKSKRRRQTYCRFCQSAYTKEHYRKNKKPYIERAKKRNAKSVQIYYDYVYTYLSEHPCVDCGETDIVVLEFDHVAENKAFNISKMRLYPLEQIKTEVAKCEVVCANCHRRRTAKRADYGILNWIKDNIGA